MAPRSGLGARPLVVVEGRAGILGQPMAAALAAARRSGWEIVRGWAPPAGRGVVCSGPIRVPDDARRALLAAASGAGLIVAASAAPATLDRFLVDLRRLGPVEHVVELVEPQPLLTDVQRALLGLLAEGLTIAEAGAQLDLGAGAARRRLAAARRRVDLSSPSAALAAALLDRS